MARFVVVIGYDGEKLKFEAMETQPVERPGRGCDANGLGALEARARSAALVADIPRSQAETKKQREDAPLRSSKAC